jgi:hypothetical protein
MALFSILPRALEVILFFYQQRFSATVGGYSLATMRIVFFQELRMKHYAALLVTAMLLSGCATQSVPLQQAELPPPSRLLLYQNVPQTPFATVVVVRDSGMLAGSCRTGVYINGEFAASLAAKEKAEFRIPVGNNEISIGQDMIENSLCIWRDTNGRLPMTLRAGESRYFRIAGDMQRGFVLQANKP